MRVLSPELQGGFAECEIQTHSGPTLHQFEIEKRGTFHWEVVGTRGSSDSRNLTLRSSTFWMDSCQESNKISFIWVLFSKLEKHGKNGCQLLIV